MSSPQKAWDRAEAISAERLMTVTAIATGAGYIARFTSDQGLRCFGQSLIQHGDKSVGILILPDGTIPQEREARAILHPQLAEREEVIATVQLAYQCSAADDLHDQGQMIHADLTRLLDADSTTGVECVAVTVQHLAPEAETYGNVEPSNVTSIQAENIGDTLAEHYGEIQDKGAQLRAALCDLRHFADAHGLDYARWDKSAVMYHSAEADQ
ncbi:hypothetical protein [Phaeobacter sp. JH20_18]|uniref:hypothetical protein n=1 Tax=Phaeobacter sp. JH20_18 TaxID=3112476 RepID=UPI003A8C0021